VREMSLKTYIKKEITCECRGKNIYGIACIPDSTDKDMPAVIFSHGFNSSHKAMLPFAEYLAQRGVVSYCYDFCGGSLTSKSQGKTTEMSIFTEKEDLNAVIDMVASWNCVDKDKLFLFGESQGGMVTAITSIERTDEIKGLMLLFPALCIPEDGIRRFKNISEIPDELDCMGMRLGKTYYENILDYDVYEYIGKFNKDVLIFHGDRDSLVDISYSKRALTVLPTAKLEIFTGEGHGFSEQGNKKVAEMVYQFIQEHIVNLI
jgi:pimeloyl-ACP methyl ester carboxylesterase